MKCNPRWFLIKRVKRGWDVVKLKSSWSTYCAYLVDKWEYSDPNVFRALCKMKKANRRRFLDRLLLTKSITHEEHMRGHMCV